MSLVVDMGSVVPSAVAEKQEMQQRNQAAASSSSTKDQAPLASVALGSISGYITANGNYICLYLVAAAIVCLTFQCFHDIGLSTLLTLSVFVQCIALAALVVSCWSRKSVQGISLKCVLMQALSFMLRLSSTSWLKGYIPVDSTGDWLYQVVDVSALLLCGLISYLICFKFRATYEEDRDTFPAKQMTLVCMVLSVLIHPDLNNRPVFDAIWTCSLYIDVFSMLPQIFMMSGEKGKTIDALSAHYVALIGISRAIDMVFWSYGYEELAPEKGGHNIAGWTVLLCHVLHLLLMADFLFLYVRALLKKGLPSAQGTMDLASVLDEYDVV